MPFLAVVALLAVTPDAFAAPSRVYQSSFATGSFGFLSPQALAVDQGSGELYALDIGNSAVHRFTAAGSPSNFTAGPSAGTNTLTGFAFDSGPGASQVAVDSSGGPSDGNIYVTDAFNGTVDVFANDGTSLGSLIGSGTPDGSFPVEPCGVAVDQSDGDVYIAAYGNRVFRYSPVDAAVSETDYSGGIATGFNPCQLAADSGDVYAAVYNGVSSGPAHRFDAANFALGPPPSPASTTIGGTVLGLYVDPANGFLYLNELTQVAVFDDTGAPSYTFGFGDFLSSGVAVKAEGPAYVADIEASQIDVFSPTIESYQLTVNKPGAGSGTITSDPPGIDCGETCEAEYSDGTEVTLTPAAESGSVFKQWSGCDDVAGDECTLTMSGARDVTAIFTSKPLISGTHASQISTVSATLAAQLNPGGEPTSYHFEYGDQGPCDVNPCTSTPVHNTGPNHSPLFVSRPISGLTSGKTYYFRLVATNAIGTTEGPGATFTTHTTDGGFAPCPNDAFRIGSSARLPDCRAYEQVTPVDKNGADMQGDANNIQASLDGDAITSFTAGGMPGGVGSQDFPTYISHRDVDGWSTRGLLPPPSFGTTAFVRGLTPDLAYALVTGFHNENTTGAGFARSTREGSMQMAFPYTFAVDIGEVNFVGATPDNSKLFFEVRGPALVPGAAPSESNLYVFDRETEALSLAGVLPDGSTPPGGSFGGPYDWFDALSNPGPLEVGGADAMYFTQERHAVSSDGSVFFTAGDTGQVYLRRNAGEPSAATEHVSASQRTNGSGPGGTDPAGPLPAEFQAATPDGDHVFFTSTEKLTNDANTGPDVTPPPPPPPPAIGRADLDGSDQDHDFIDQLTAEDVAVDGSHVYWVDSDAGAIGRADLNGENSDPDFITGAANPQSITVGSGHIYWTNFDTDTIGRADIDGNNVNQSFIVGSATDDPEGIDVNATHLFWANRGRRSIGRAELDGTGVNQSFLTVLSNETPRAIAVTDTYMFILADTGENQGWLIRYDIDGDKSSETFTGSGGNANGVEVDDSHVYWTSQQDAIARADHDFSAASRNLSFIPDLPNPRGIIVNATHIFWSTEPEGEFFANPGRDLYRYDSDSETLTDLTPLQSAVNGAEVQGLLGASDDGQRVYFVANGVLAPGAAPGDCVRNGLEGKGKCNLYLWDAGAITFIANLDGTAEGLANWRPTSFSGAGGASVITARVSEDGDVLLFRSSNQLTPYENDGIPQFYRYDASEGELICVSCNPTGAAPTGVPTLQRIRPFLTGPAQTNATNTRNLSADGNRIFFETPDKLLASDVNGDGDCRTIGGGGLVVPACLDVYLWEAQGSGSCKEATMHGGCLYLLSTGTSASASFFADASADGDHAFIFTRDRLVPQDEDDLVDIYRAGVGGGLASQHQALSPACEGEACRGAGTAAPSASGAGTGVFQGAGNRKAKHLSGKRCPKGKRKVRRRGRARCVKRSSKRQHRIAKKTGRPSR